MRRATKYILAIAIVGLVYLCAYSYWNNQPFHDDIGLDFLFIYLAGGIAGFIAALAAIVFDFKRSSLFYLSVCLFNLSLGHIFITTGFSGVFIAFLLPVIMGLTMLIMHVNALKQKQ